MPHDTCEHDTDHTDRRKFGATLIAHSILKSQRAEVWVWSDGWVTKRMGKKKRFAWRPERGAEGFAKDNRMKAPTEAAYENF